MVGGSAHAAAQQKGKAGGADLAAQAQKLYDGGAPKAAILQFVQGAMSESGTADVELQWRLARAIYDVAKEAKDPEAKKTGVMAAHEAALQALALDESCSAAHKWAGITLSAKGDFIPTKEKIANSRRVRQYWDKAAELSPSDATTLNLLGLWCFNLASLSWAERQIAALLFGSPPKSTFEEALAFFLQAEASQPEFWSANQLWIAKMSLALGKKEEGKKWLQSALKLPVKPNSDDVETQKEVEALLKKNGWVA